MAVAETERASGVIGTIRRTPLHYRPREVVPAFPDKENTVKKSHLGTLGAAITVALLLLLGAPGVFAQEEGEPTEDVVLIGQLSLDDLGGYVLIEEESGDSIALYSETDLEEFVGVTVKVVGKWVEDIDGNTYFEVHQIQQSA